MDRATTLSGVALIWAVVASGVAGYALSESHAGPAGPPGTQGPVGEQGATGEQGPGLSQPSTYGNPILMRNYRRLILAIWCGPNGNTGVLGTVTLDDGSQLQVCSAQ
jgi:hypothetical protein